MKTSKSNFKNIKDWYHKNTLLNVVKALQKRDFIASCFPNVNLLNKNILKTIPKSATVGIPGSITIRELGIIKKLEKRGNKIIHHWRKGLTEKINKEIRKEEGLADYYLTSANAITINGDIINIDGIGNPVKETQFAIGHSQPADETIQGQDKGLAKTF